MLKTLIRAALLTGARAGELTSLKREQLDFEVRTIPIGKAKTKAGRGRVIPMNQELLDVLALHASWFTQEFGVTHPQQYVFPFGSPCPCDPSKLTVEIKTVWNKVREDAGVKCHSHDPRHTCCSDLNEMGVSEASQPAIFGWSSRKSVERYSHIGTSARREAMNSLTQKPPKKKQEEPFSVEVPQDLPQDRPPERVM